MTDSIHTGKMTQEDYINAYYAKKGEHREKKTELIKTKENKKNTNFVGAPAPKLSWHGDKWNNKGTYEADTRPKGYYFYQLPMPIMDYIYETLNGKYGLLTRIMEVLIGTDEGFNISEKWICQRIGIDTKNRNSMAAYRRARKKLCNMGWLELDTENHHLYVCYDFLWQEAYVEPEDRQPVLEWMDQNDE